MFSWVYSLHYHLPHKEDVSKGGGGGGGAHKHFFDWDVRPRTNFNCSK